MKLFSFLICNILMFVTEVTTISAMNLITAGHLKKEAIYSSERVIGLIMYNIIYLLLVILFILLWRRIIYKIKTKSLVLFILFPLNQLILLTAIVYDNIVYNDNVIMYIGGIGLLFSVAADIVMLNSVNATSEKLLAEEKLEFLEIQRSLELKYFDLMQYHIKKLELIKHDFKNQLQIVNGLLESNDYKNKISAKEIVDSLSEDMNKLKGINFCKNSLVNTVLAVKKNHADEFGIDTSIQVNIPEEITIEKIDLSSLFLNLFDNAIEASEKITDNQIKKCISIKASIISGYLVVKFENTTLKSRLIKTYEAIKSTKENPRGHGYGLQIINSIALKYDGNLDIDVQKDKFIVKVTLKI
ncbi:MAG: GHKL domain-containing protein [Burkholderiales bacterium]|nr:GHKL domain-containing protein [Burkholderiales bacterium]